MRRFADHSILANIAIKNYVRGLISEDESIELFDEAYRLQNEINWEIARQRRGCSYGRSINH